jgi:prolyl-tRNA synthetase
MELIGIPYRLVVSDRGLENDQIEFKERRLPDSTLLPLGDTVEYLRNLLKDLL